MYKVLYGGMCSAGDAANDRWPFPHFLLCYWGGFFVCFPQVGIHPSAAEEFVTMRSVTRRVTAGGKPKTTNP